MFSGLRSGNQIYILSKLDTPKLLIGIVLSTTGYTPYLLNSTLDISVKVGNETMDFKLIPGQLSIANCNGVTISETRELMSSEVESMIRQSKQILDSLPYHKAVINEGEEILKQLNPLYAKLKDLEEKICHLETKVGGIESKLDTISEMLTKVLNK